MQSCTHFWLLGGATCEGSYSRKQKLSHPRNSRYFPELAVSWPGFLLQILFCLETRQRDGKNPGCPPAVPQLGLLGIMRVKHGFGETQASLIPSPAHQKFFLHLYNENYSSWTSQPVETSSHEEDLLKFCGVLTATAPTDS